MQLNNNNNALVSFGAIKNIDFKHSKIHDGESFRAFTKLSIGAGLSSYIQIITGANAIHLNDIIEVDGNNTIDTFLYENPTVTNGSTVIPTIQNNRISTNTSTTILYSNPTGVNGGVLVNQEYLGGGGASVSGSINNSNEMILKPDSDYIFHFTNYTGSGTATLFVKFGWYEVIIPDLIAPTKTGEDFSALLNKGEAFIGTMTFSENIASYSNLSISGTGGSIIVTSGIGTRTLSFSGVAPMSNSGQISIKVTDTSGNISNTIISNNYGLYGNPPVMGVIPNQNITSGVAFSFNPSSYVTLTEGDVIEMYWLYGDTLPTGLIFDDVTGIISGTTTQTGTFAISISAQDYDGESNASGFNLIVT